MTILNYPITRSVLAKHVYKINRHTFAIWLKNIGIYHNRTLSPADLRKIFAEYELPLGVEIKGI